MNAFNTSGPSLIGRDLEARARARRKSAGIVAEKRAKTDAYGTIHGLSVKSDLRTSDRHCGAYSKAVPAPRAPSLAAAQPDGVAG